MAEAIKPFLEESIRMIAVLSLAEAGEVMEDSDCSLHHSQLKTQNYSYCIE